MPWDVWHRLTKDTQAQSRIASSSGDDFLRRYENEGPVLRNGAAALLGKPLDSDQLIAWLEKAVAWIALALSRSIRVLSCR
jgi:hypothetical protein